VDGKYLYLKHGFHLNPPYPRATEETHMAERDTHVADPAPGDDTDVGPSRDYPGMPRWVKVSGIIALILVLLVVVTMVAGVGGQHGPGRHMPSGGASSYIMPMTAGTQWA
jgi:hypothetical protein